MRQRYTSPNENFEYGYTHSNAFLQFYLKSERCKRQKGRTSSNLSMTPTISDSISQDILLQIFYLIQSDVVLQNQVH